MRVLIIDDSAFMRKIISQMIESTPGLEVAGVARNGREGVEMTQKLLPDLITLDIEMPELDGLGALRQIRIKCRDLAPGVLMCSSLTTEGSNEALKALRLGAADVIAKDPSTLGKQEQSFKEELVGKLKVIGSERQRVRRGPTPGDAPAGGLSVGPAPEGPAAARTASPIRAATYEELRLGEIDAVVVGSSTGGPPVLEDIFIQLPPDLRVPVFVAQHMPAVFTRSLAGRLGQQCACPVSLITEETDITTPGIYIAEGGRHMHIENRRGRVTASMSAEPVKALFRPSVSVLFETAARAFGARVLAVQLTGMGDDGLTGARSLREAGGRVIAQHESTCVVYGMPRAVVEAGMADAVMTPAQIGGLLRRLGASRAAGSGGEPGQSCARRSA